MAANLQLAARGSRTAPLDPLLAIGEVIQRHQQERVWAAEERAREQHILQHIADVVTGCLQSPAPPAAFGRRSLLALCLSMTHLVDRTPRPTCVFLVEPSLQMMYVRT